MIKPQYHRAAWPVQMLSDRDGALARIECAECGSHGEWRISSQRPPPEVLPKHFQQCGWQVSKKPVCPECQQKKREIKVANITPIKNEASSSAEQTDAAKKVKRMIYMALEDYFDDQKGCYREGKSDAILGRELGAAEQFVRTIREADFGALKEPPELVEIRSQISNLTSQLGQLQSKLETISRKGGW